MSQENISVLGKMERLLTLSFCLKLSSFTYLPWWLDGKKSTCQCRKCKKWGFDPWVGKMPWRRKWQPTPEFLTGKSHKQRSLVGYSPWICKRVGQDLVTKYHHMPLWGSRASPHPWLKEAPCSKRHIKHLPNQGNSPYIRCWENKPLSIRYIHT